MWSACGSFLKINSHILRVTQRRPLLLLQFPRVSTCSDVIDLWWQRYMFVHNGYMPSKTTHLPNSTAHRACERELTHTMCKTKIEKKDRNFMKDTAATIPHHCVIVLIIHIFSRFPNCMESARLTFYFANEMLMSNRARGQKWTKHWMPNEWRRLFRADESFHF